MFSHTVSRFLSELCCNPGRAAAKARIGRGRSGTPVTAFFTTVDGTTYNVDLRTDSSVADAKVALSEFTGVREDEQQLFRESDEDEELDDESRPFSLHACAETVFRIAFASTLHEARSRRHIFRYRSSGPDAWRFDHATETDNVEELVSLLSSMQVVERVLEPRHPWAANPKTIGALAAAQIAGALSAEVDSESASNGDRDASDCALVKRTTFSAGGIPILVEFLRSGLEDRVHTAVLALQFLTPEPEGAANAKAAYDAGAMPLLIGMLSSTSTAQASAAATALRHIFVVDKEYRKMFVELGGLKGLVGQLPTMSQLPPDETASLPVLETVLNLQDLMEDRQGNNISIISDYARLAVQLGAIKKLELLKETAAVLAAQREPETQPKDNSWADLHASVTELIETLVSAQENRQSPRALAGGG